MVVFYLHVCVVPHALCMYLLLPACCAVRAIENAFQDFFIAGTSIVLLLLLCAGLFGETLCDMYHHISMIAFTYKRNTESYPCS